MKIRAILLCPIGWHSVPQLIVPQFKGVYLRFPVVNSGIAKLATATHGEHCLTGRFMVDERRLSPGGSGLQVPGGLHPCLRTSMA